MPHHEAAPAETAPTPPASYDVLAVLALLSGPLAWALDEALSYFLVPRVRAADAKTPLHVVTVAAIVVLAAGAGIAVRVLRGRHGRADAPARSRFLALGGLAMDAFFLVVVLAEAVPKFMLGARQ